MNDTDLLLSLLPVDRYELRQFSSGPCFFGHADGKPVVVELVDMPDPGSLHRARSLAHPNVQQILEVFPSPAGLVVVRAFQPGVSLHVLIRKRKARGGYMVGERRRLASQICDGLTAIHAAGFVDGNLMPGNVMVHESHAMIFGWGLLEAGARMKVPTAPRPGREALAYVSPERARGGSASPEDDVYALGLTLLEMWTCRVPETTHGPLARPLRDQIPLDAFAALTPRDLVQFFRMLKQEPKQRPQARELSFIEQSSAGAAEPAGDPRVLTDGEVHGGQELSYAEWAEPPLWSTHE